MKYLKIKEPYENNTLIMKVHHEEKDCYVCEYKYSDIWLRASKDWVIAQADTIEELCDEFVNVSRVSKEIRITGEYHLVEHSLNIIKGMSGITYGAIWTSKGLIYVAQMNNKGELELI